VADRLTFGALHVVLFRGRAGRSVLARNARHAGRGCIIAYDRRLVGCDFLLADRRKVAPLILAARRVCNSGIQTYPFHASRKAIWVSSIFVRCSRRHASYVEEHYQGRKGRHSLAAYRRAQHPEARYVTTPQRVREMRDFTSGISRLG